MDVKHIDGDIDSLVIEKLGRGDNHFITYGDFQELQDKKPLVASGLAYYSRATLKSGLLNLFCTMDFSTIRYILNVMKVHFDDWDFVGLACNGAYWSSIRMSRVNNLLRNAFSFSHLSCDRKNLEYACRYETAQIIREYLPEVSSLLNNPQYEIFADGYSRCAAAILHTAMYLYNLKDKDFPDEEILLNFHEARMCNCFELEF